MSEKVFVLSGYDGEKFSAFIDYVHDKYQQREPMTITVQEGKRRSIDQNSISHKWYAQIAMDTGEMSAHEVRRFCKLHFGVPILRAESTRFRESYDLVIKPMEYPMKLVAMEIFPVTRLMKTKQMTRYLKDIQKHYADRNTDPVLLQFPEEYLQS